LRHFHLTKLNTPNTEIGKYLVADPEICHGKLTFKGSRVPVGTVITFLAMGDSIKDILRNWPQLSREAVEEAIRLAADLVLEHFPGQKVAA